VGWLRRSELDSTRIWRVAIKCWLMDERFYHLDTCFCPLNGGYLLYYPQAFDSYSNRMIEMRVRKSGLLLKNRMQLTSPATRSMTRLW